MERFVFISHSSNDKGIADKICDFLEANGISCWIAPRDVTPGKNYGAAILDAIDECSVFVLILSSDSNKSGQVVREVERAASTDSIIIPFRVEAVQPSRNLEFYVSSAHWLDAVTKPFDKHLRELLKAIKNWQQSGAALSERAPAPISESPAALTPSSAFLETRRRYLSPTIAVAAGLGIVLCAIFGYEALRHKKSRTGKELSAVASTNQTPTPPAPTQPSATATVAATSTSTSPPIVSASPALTIPSEVAASIPTPSPRRLKPGEPLRSTAQSEALSQPSIGSSPTVTPLRKKPGELLSPPAVPVIREVTASSEQRFAGVSHKAGLAFDANPITAWVPKTDGVGQSISVHFKVPVTITSVSLLSSPANHFMNNRVRTLRITFNDSATQVLTFEDKMKIQRFELQHHPGTEWVKLEILSVFRGKKYNRTPISEIAFNRDAAEP